MRFAPLSVVTLLFATGALAQQPLEWSGEFRLQQDLGGEVMVSVPYSDGTISDLRAGTYFSFLLGGSLVPLRLGAHALDVTGQVGFGGWSTGPDNTDDRLNLERLPLELLAGYRLDLPDSPLALRLAGGVQYQLLGDVHGSGSLERVKVPVDNALGWVAELRGVYQAVSVSLRYTKRTYHFPATGADLDASSFGIGLGFVFPARAPSAPAANGG